jgi:hypothetical protein
LPRLPLPAIASVLSCTLTAATIPATVLTLLLPGAAFAQGGPGAPNVYAITNARIVPVSGPIIPKGTIVLRDGLIAALGAGVAAPADAQVIDGAGLTVYPALVNGYGRVGMPSASEYPAARGDVYSVSTIRAENSAPALLKPDTAAALALRRVGFATSLGRAVCRDTFRHQRGRLARRCRRSVHACSAPGGVYARRLHRIRYPRRRQLPRLADGTDRRDPAGVYDTRTAATVGDAFAKDPRGRTRPVTPRALVALRPVVVEKKQTLVMHADSAQSIRRALKVARNSACAP